MSQPLDPIDTIATKAFEGYVVRKDLVRKFKGQYPIPTYVAEFLLGRYCASVDEDEIAEYITDHIEGNSLIAAGDEDLVKIHFHTNEPWKVLEYCSTIGEIYDIVIEDMIRQSSGLHG